MLKRLKGQRGFTLIELLIVIVIIGILAGIVIGLTGSSARKKSRDATRKANVHEIQNALEQYMVDNDAYPAQLSGLTNLSSTATTTPSNTTYTYTPTDSNTKYTLSVTLENTADSGPNITAGVYSVSQKQ